jgi:probable HAF family extracellular repeat protein
MKNVSLNRKASKLLALWFLCLTAVGGLFSTAALAQTYSVTDLGVLPGGSSRVHQINANGETAGDSGSVYGTRRHGFLWTKSGGLQDLGTLRGGDYSQAFSINSVGEIAGTSNTATSMHAFRWSSGAGLQDLGVLPGSNSSQAYAINDRNQVAGASGTHAVIWNGGTIQDLGGLPGARWSEAHGLNNEGQVVGVSLTANGQHAFLWSRGEMRDLGTLPGDVSSRANLINDEGVIVGASEGPNGARAFLWSDSTGMEPLGLLSGGTFSEAFGLNNLGQVVGQSGSSLGTRPFLWTAANGMIDLNTVAATPANVVLTGAFAINDKGQIVAFGIADDMINSGREAHGDIHVHHAGTHAFLLSPK